MLNIYNDIPVLMEKVWFKPVQLSLFQLMENTQLQKPITNKHMRRSKKWWWVKLLLIWSVVWCFSTICYLRGFGTFGTSSPHLSWAELVFWTYFIEFRKPLQQQEAPWLHQNFTSDWKSISSMRGHSGN